MKSHIHYERAFESFLRARAIPYVPVDESRKISFRDARLKSFDFIVYSAGASNWLVDIKGRRWAARGDRRPAWENWVTLADLDGLESWQEVFGADYRALLVFAYAIEHDSAPPEEIAYRFDGVTYAFAAVPADAYRAAARLRSPKWGTVNMPRAEFARVVRPIDQWL